MWDWLKTITTKASVGRSMFAQDFEYSMVNLQAYAKEGYAQNPTVYSCISLIADAFGSVPLQVKVNDEVQESHPLLDLLERPNPDEGGNEFRTAAASWITLTGNCFTEKLNVSQDKWELWNWQPYEMTIQRRKGERLPAGYIFGKGQAHARYWELDRFSGKCDMLHWRTFNPSPEAPSMGQAPVQAGGASADQMNAASKWRYNTFKNNAAPSGILSTEKDIDNTKRKSLERNLKERQQGEENARDIMLLGGGLKWQQMAMSPQDMDWLQGTKMLAQEIASVFRVPTQLLGIEGSQTYANYEEAKLAFWLQAVLPKLDLYVNELNRWLAPEFGDNVEICYNKESIEALEPLRREKRRELLETSVLTINEKRELLSYEEMDEDEASTLFIQPNDIPLGADFLDEEDQTLQQAAKALMKLEGLDYKDAYQRAFELRQDADESEL